MKFKLLLMLLFCIVIIQCGTEKEAYDPKPRNTVKNPRDVFVSYLENYDADTITVTIDEFKNFDLHNKYTVFWKSLNVRVKGIDTPEIRDSKCQKEKDLALKAKTFVENELKNAKVIRLFNLEPGKYFRVVADISYDGNSLAPLLIEKEYAVEYFGQTKEKDWCK